ncbi:hypothetical protein DUNSADRAFT_9110 [Dunaliella salina]|uniref:Uncharacterized protein n=1 Tax=Dunaliella salina TaxID=3046 RepID=A0ABQ7GI54_DUNSA|nr:hypothetical protein DUNSADRAFT_9110 [Dunaliella salina]|eukprot:KAF5834287.1 hypothetical protein DUNSADRAFT_9110 [Dunaliella salina]
MLARRDVYDFGCVPLHSLCPQLDSLGTLQKLHAQLLSRSSSCLESGAKLTSGQDVMAVLDLSSTQLQILCGVLTPLSLCLPPDGTPLSAKPVPGSFHQPQPQQQPMLAVHELSMFLLVQLFSKEAQRPDNTEVWPDAGPSLSPLSVSDNMCSSPTRASFSRSPSGKTMLRQQLQQHLRNQSHAMRGFGDYLRRNLAAIAEFALFSPPAQKEQLALMPGSGQQPQPPTHRASMTAAEVDCMQFLIQPAKQHQEVCF